MNRLKTKDNTSRTIIYYLILAFSFGLTISTVSAIYEHFYNQYISSIYSINIIPNENQIAFSSNDSSTFSSYINALDAFFDHKHNNSLKELYSLKNWGFNESMPCILLTVNLNENIKKQLIRENVTYDYDSLFQRYWQYVSTVYGRRALFLSCIASPSIMHSFQPMLEFNEEYPTVLSVQYIDKNHLFVVLPPAEMLISSTLVVTFNMTDATNVKMKCVLASRRMNYYFSELVIIKQQS